VELTVRESGGAAVFRVLVSAGSARPGIRGLHGDSLKIAVAAPPEKGKANDEVAAVIAGWLGVPLRAVTVEAGAASRRKLIRVAGADGGRIRAAADSVAKKART